MRTFLVAVFFAGMILVVLNEMIKKPKTLIEYRYLPRDLDAIMRDEKYYPVGDVGKADDNEYSLLPNAAPAPSFFSQGTIIRQ